MMIDIILKRTVEGTSFDLKITGRTRKLDRYTEKTIILANEKAYVEFQLTKTDLHQKYIMRILVQVQVRIVIHQNDSVMNQGKNSGRDRTPKGK